MNSPTIGAQPLPASWPSAYRGRSTDSISPCARNAGKLAIFIFAAWAGLEAGGVIAGLAVCGVVFASVSSASDLMQDFRTGCAGQSAAVAHGQGTEHTAGLGARVTELSTRQACAHGTLVPIWQAPNLLHMASHPPPPLSPPPPQYCAQVPHPELPACHVCGPAHRRVLRRGAGPSLLLALLVRLPHRRAGYTVLCTVSHGCACSHARRCYTDKSGARMEPAQ